VICAKVERENSNKILHVFYIFCSYRSGQNSTQKMTSIIYWVVKFVKISAVKDMRYFWLWMSLYPNFRQFLSALSEIRYSDLSIMMFGVYEFLKNRFGNDIFSHWRQSNDSWKIGLGMTYFLTEVRVMILGKWPTWRTNSFLCIYFYF
jgi:hypothetical protein